MSKTSNKSRFRLNLLAAVMTAFGTGQLWAAAGDVCVDDGVAGEPDCVVPTGTVTTAGQDINTGTGSITTTNLTATGDVDATTGTIDTLDGTDSTFTTYSDGVGTTITGGDVDADTGTIDTLDGTDSTFTTYSDGAGTTITGGTVTATTFDDGTVTLSGGELTDGSNSITMDGTDASVNLSNGFNSLQFDDTGATVSASDDATTGTVAVTATEASVTVDNGTATHGLTVGIDNTRLSGGTASSFIDLNDAGMQFDSSSSSATLEMNQHRITGLADGVNDYDAVNKGQLDDVEETANSGIAAVAAMLAVPGPLPGHKFSIGIGGGYYESESAIAIGASANISDSLRITASAGTSSGNTAGGIGMGFSW